jgi:hypothetical protein
MRWVGDVFWPLVYAAIMAGCIYWASWFYGEARLQERWNLSRLGRLFVVLALGSLVYSPVYRIVVGLLNILRPSSIASKLGEFVGAALILAMLVYLFMWIDKPEQP